MSDSTSTAPLQTFALVGPGRAGTAVSLALVASGVRALGVAGRAPDARSTRRLADRLGVPAVTADEVGRDAELVVIATPDAAIEAVATKVAPSLRHGALVLHLSGARGVEALTPIAIARPDVLVGGLHPLQTLPAIDDAVPTSLAGAWAAVAGPPIVTELARLLGMQPFTIDDRHRAQYHAAATIASNHFVALLGQVERVATNAGVSFAVFEPLIRATVDNVMVRGPRAALTGPVARGDIATVIRHLDALPPAEQAAYRALAIAALQLAERDDAPMRALLEQAVPEQEVLAHDASAPLEVPA